MFLIGFEPTRSKLSEKLLRVGKNNDTIKLIKSQNQTYENVKISLYCAGSLLDKNNNSQIDSIVLDNGKEIFLNQINQVEL